MDGRGSTAIGWNYVMGDCTVSNSVFVASCWLCESETYCKQCNDMLEASKALREEYEAKKELERIKEDEKQIEQLGFGF